MKKLSYFFILWIVTTLAYAAGPVSVLAPVDDLFIPIGFDSNDSAEIIVTGHFPNLCYKSPQTKVVFDGKKINVTVEALRYQDDTICAEIIVPFIETVSLGILNKGKYDIIVNVNTPWEKEQELEINESTSNSIDDFIYANVEFVEKTLTSRTVILRGHNPSDCLVLDEIEVVSNKLDTYSILPKMKRISDFCPMKMVPFSYELEVPKEGLNKDIILLHVRVMDGKSVNSIFPNYIQ